MRGSSDVERLSHKQEVAVSKPPPHLFVSAIAADNRGVPTSPGGASNAANPSAGESLLTKAANYDYSPVMIKHSIRFFRADPWNLPKIQCSCDWELQHKAQMGRDRAADLLLDAWLIHKAAKIQAGKNVP